MLANSLKSSPANHSANINKNTPIYTHIHNYVQVRVTY